MVKKMTQFKRFPTAKAAMKTANRINGAITDADSEFGYKSGFVAYTTKKKKIRGWKSKKIEY